jgi:hypothetical protein
MAREHQKRGRMEHPDYSEKGAVRDRHSEGGPGTRPDGTKVHGQNYVQPWVKNDPVLPDPAHEGKEDVG